MMKQFAAYITLVSVASAMNVVQAADREEIAKLIPSATSMTRADFDRLARSGRSPVDVEDKSLTLMLLSIPADEKRSDEQKREFNYLSKAAPRPSEIASEMVRRIGKGKVAVRLSPLTLIHSNRIRDVTCEVKGEKARGVVTFEVPELYRGQVSYVAKKTRGKWQITELQMPANKVHIVRKKDGNWTKAEN